MQYNILNIKLWDTQLDKLKLATNNVTGLILRLLSNMIGPNNDIKLHINYYWQIDKLQILIKAFANNTAINVKLSKAQIQLWWISW